MNSSRNNGRGLVAGVGVALLAGLTLASTPVFAEWCSVSSGTTWSGREWGWVEPDKWNPQLCWRSRVGGPAPNYIKSCHSVAREKFFCTEVRDI